VDTDHVAYDDRLAEDYRLGRWSSETVIDKQVARSTNEVAMTM
jgi:hypothetical protein